MAAIYGQPMWSTATIEICPYKDPRHCTNLLVTLITLWLPYRFTLVSETDCVRHLPGMQLADITSLTILGTFTRWESFMPLMATSDSLTDV